MGSLAKNIDCHLQSTQGKLVISANSFESDHQSQEIPSKFGLNWPNSIEVWLIPIARFEHKGELTFDRVPTQIQKHNSMIFPRPTM